MVRRLSRPDLIADRRAMEAAPLKAISAEAFDEAERELQHLITSGKLDERHVRQYAQRGEIAQLILSLSFIFKCRRGSVEQLLNAECPDQFLLRARQMEFSNATVKSILESGHWRRHLSRAQRELAMQKYQSLSRRDAQLMMAPAA